MNDQDFEQARIYWRVKRAEQRTLIVAIAVLAVVIVALFLAPHLADAASYQKVYPWGFAADSDGNEVLEATCASGGTQFKDADDNAQNPGAQLYWVTCSVEECFLCDASTCASPDGVAFPAGFADFYRVKTAGAYACRSALSAAVMRMHPIE
ncbi:MAG: hypothetical protein ACE5FA_04745 [Dehalococcoidia bacterium]